MVQAGAPASNFADPSATPPQFTKATATTPFQYTRAGNLALTPYTDATNTTASYLTTQSGQYVLGYSARQPPDQRATGRAVYPDRDSRRGEPTSRSPTTAQVTYTDANDTQQVAGYLALATVETSRGCSVTATRSGA